METHGQIWKTPYSLFQSDAEIDKENLKELVSKWNENPNNRYAFEQATENVISPSGETVQIRRPDAGSRRGSLARGKSDVRGLSHIQKHTHYTILSKI